jgi:CubicO group peptidase (beta-lactamase class C family)
MRAPARAIDKAWRASAALLIAAVGFMSTAHAASGAAPRTDLDDYGVKIDALCEAAVRSGAVVGASVVVIREGRAVWASAYGVGNALLGTHLTIDSALPAASLGKPIAALAALRAVERGQLALDAPLAAAAQAIEGAPPVTLRELLTHTAGLSNFLGERVHHASRTPRPRFRYSGVGFLVLQDVLEADRSSGFAQIARDDVLAPLAMRSTSFDRNDLPVAARPHMQLGQLLIPGGLVLATLWTLFGLIVLWWRRRRSGRWSITAAPLSAALVAAAVVSALFLYQRSGSWLAAVTFAAAPLACAVIALLLLGLASRVENRGHKSAICSFVVVGVAAALFACKEVPVPLPELGARRVNAAASLYASAPDLARLLIEIARPGALSFDVTGALVTPQQAVNRDVSWGLGIGLASTPRGPVAWHRGAAPGAQGLMLIELTTANGVVVLVNDGNGRALVDAVASAATGLQVGWNTSPD